MKSKRRNYSAQFKAKVALAAAKGDKTMAEQIFYGVNSQLSKDRRAGKPVDFLEPGLKNSAVRCETELVVATEAIPAGALIQIANVQRCIVPSFATVESTMELKGSIGTKDQPCFFGRFSLPGGRSPAMVLPDEGNVPLKTGGAIFIRIDKDDFAAGGKINVKLFYTQ